jgi:hypothetical protein
MLWRSNDNWLGDAVDLGDDILRSELAFLLQRVWIEELGV